MLCMQIVADLTWIVGRTYVVWNKITPCFRLEFGEDSKHRHCEVETNLKAHQKEIGFQIELI